MTAEMDLQCRLPKSVITQVPLKSRIQILCPLLLAQSHHRKLNLDFGGHQHDRRDIAITNTKPDGHLLVLVVRARLPGT